MTTERGSSKPRGLKLTDFVLEQLKTKPVESVEEAHEKYVVVLNPLDYKYLLHLVWAQGPMHKKGSQKKLWINGFTCWQSPAIPFARPKLLLREDAIGVLGEFAEALHGIS